MFEYRHVLTRMRLGDTNRAIARAGLMGRRKAAQLRRTAEAAGWLDVATTLPDDPELAVSLGSVRTQPAVASLAKPHRERITRWWRQCIQGTTIHAALVRSHGFTGSYSSVRRFLAGVEAAHPQVTTVLEFDPGEAAQVDFGKGPEVLDPRFGELLSTWIFVMTLAWSRRAAVERGVVGRRAAIAEAAWSDGPKDVLVLRALRHIEHVVDLAGGARIEARIRARRRGLERAAARHEGAHRGGLRARTPSRRHG